MVRERVQREAPRHILEEIKEKTKVMRNKQLRRAAARSRGTRARLAHQSASNNTSSAHSPQLIVVIICIYIDRYFCTFYLFWFNLFTFCLFLAI